MCLCFLKQWQMQPKITANPSDLEFVYNGSVRLVELKDILSGSYPTDVNIKYSNTDGSVATPLNAGTYLVTVTRTGDENWRSFEATKKLVIKKAKVVKVVAPTASTITEGQSLSESLLSGGVAKGADGTTISGKFEWADASVILKPGNSQKKEVIFTSYDPNYEDATTEAEVTVKSSDALVVTFAQPENGSLKVYMLKGEGEKTEITSGTAVAKATKLTIEAEANPDYELTVIQIGEEKYMTSPVEIEVDKSLAIMAEFKPVSTPPGTDVAVTGVSLNITSKALAVGESFALQAKVTPNNATMKTVSWSSSDETVATVDADGVVTALKIGTCKITVATDDGNKTASCVVTVSGTVGIEQIINDHQIYCERGAITVHPARPISIRIIAVTGVSLYGDSIIGTTRIPVSTGIYDTSKGLLILAATNRPEVLDKALLRPGRFDRRIIVDKPDLKGRLETLKVHSKDVLMDETVDLDALALATAGLVGSDLANMINEAAINAVKKGRKYVNQADLFEAFELVAVGGKEKKDRVMSDKERKIVSYHEVGHAIVTALQKNTEPVQKITIVPRTMGALGYTLQTPEEEKFLQTKDELLAKITTYMAGRAAEVLVFSSATSGAANDIENATAIARAMVTQYGMSDKFGMMCLATTENQYLDNRAGLICGEETAAQIDGEVLSIINKCYDDAMQLLIENRESLDKISEYLYEHETITGKEFMKIFREIKGIPEPEEESTKKSFMEQAMDAERQSKGNDGE